MKVDAPVEELVEAASEATPAGIRVLPAELADQIAAGEVVERPAAIIKELLDNAVDAGATRIEVELAGGGITRIVVVDDGAGIVADELGLAVTRHATSKLSSASDLLEPQWLGFRGEALASIAAVAHVTIDTRTAHAAVGTRLTSRPGLGRTLEACAHPNGTRIEITGLFANVPARRKFMRSVATELSHCLETVARVALVHPGVGFRLRHEGRVILDVARADQGERVAQLLARRGAGALRHFAGTFEGVEVRAWVGEGDSDRSDVQVVVRRRVIRERVIAQIFRDAWQGRTPPCACIVVEPPRGTVDVNVHPQKAEVRFSDAQRVYAAVRRALATLELSPTPGPSPTATRDADSPGLWAAGLAPPSHSEAQSTVPTLGLFATAVDADPPGPVDAAPHYALRTRAAEPNYAQARERLHADAAALGTLTAGHAATVAVVADAAPAEPELIDCLPGPVALMRWQDDLLAVDLRLLRTHLLRRRLLAELGGGALSGQALLIPAVVELGPQDVALVEVARAELERLGLVVDPFGEHAVVVRTIPAELRRCVDDVDAAAVLARVLPYLRARRRDALEPADAVNVLAECAGSHVAARFARRLMREALESGLGIDDIPGVRRWTGIDLVEPAT